MKEEKNWIIATAISTRSLLVHKDPEFERVADRLQLEPCPISQKSTPDTSKLMADLRACKNRKDRKLLILHGTR